MTRFWSERTWTVSGRWVFVHMSAPSYLPLHLRIIQSIQSRRRNAAGALNAARKCATRCAPYMHTLARHVFTVTIA